MGGRRLGPKTITFTEHDGELFKITVDQLIEGNTNNFGI